MIFSAGKLDKEKGEGTRAGFILPAAPGTEPFFVGVPIYEPYGKISGRAYSGKLSLRYPPPYLKDFKKLPI
jgi:hypothetical protein